jgi:sarcosine oxidase
VTGTYDVAVVGLGAIGSAAAYACARRGAAVVGFERFELGHERGASHDHSRIIRLSYHTDWYVELAKQAYAAWATVERDCGEQLVLRTGGIDLFPQGAAIDGAPYEAAMRAAGVGFDVLDGAGARERWPQFAVADDVRVLYQHETGIVAAARATAALQSLACSNGAELRERTPVHAIEPRERDVVIVTDGGTVRAAHVVVACDAWANDLLGPLGHALPLTVLREQLTYFASDRLADFAPDRFPVWIWMDDPSFYGFPVFGEPAVKAAEDCGGFEVDPGTRDFEPDPRMEQRLDLFTHALLAPGAIGAPLRTKTCLYTLTPDRDFVLDRLPDAPRVSVALGAAHGFKFAAWFGRALAQLALDGGTSARIAPFAIDRPALTRAGAARTWLV